MDGRVIRRVAGDGSTVASRARRGDGTTTRSHREEDAAECGGATLGVSRRGVGVAVMVEEPLGGGLLVRHVARVDGCDCRACGFRGRKV